MKKYIGLLTISALFSCTAKKVLVAEVATSKELTSEKIIERHYNDKMRQLINNLKVKLNTELKLNNCIKQCVK
jgi:demethoxyubiquinone hydroxylase (CLK1/Coq7/Cat5 family)